MTDCADVDAPAQPTRGAAPAVSVILPTHDRLRFLSAAIESVMAQGFSDWELIIADDGSDAQTVAYLKTLLVRPNVSIVWLAHSGKPGRVRNAALRQARAPFVAFLDSDDVWLPDKLALQVASLQARPHCGWSCTGFVAVDAGGRRLEGQRGREWPAASGWIFESLICMEAVIALPSVMVRRDLLLRLNGFDETLSMCEDYDLWLRLAKCSELDAVPDLLLQIRRHGEHCGSDAIAFEERARVLDKLLDSDPSLGALVRRERARVAIGLARSHAVYGSGLDAFRALLRSPSYAWRYPEWWLGACETAARAVTPEGARRIARRVLRG